MEKRKALLIEDSKFSQNLLIIIFEDLGWETPTVVTKGKKALQVLKEQADTFAVIILDQRLPGLTGLETLAAAKKTVRRLPPVIMVTATSDPTLKARAEELGVAEFLLKNKLNKASLKKLLAKAVR
jgi:two-component system NtrC family response regulator